MRTTTTSGWKGTVRLATDYRQYLQPETVSKLKGMELRARMVVEGFIAGLHKSPYHGFSVEFAEHRQYMPGDDIRRIDWKVFAKTDRYYIKQYEEETNLKGYLLLDCSASMNYKSAPRSPSSITPGLLTGAAVIHDAPPARCGRAGELRSEDPPVYSAAVAVGAFARAAQRGRTAAAEQSYRRRRGPSRDGRTDQAARAGDYHVGPARRGRRRSSPVSSISVTTITR